MKEKNTTSNVYGLVLVIKLIGFLFYFDTIVEALFYDFSSKMENYLNFVKPVRY